EFDVTFVVLRDSKFTLEQIQARAKRMAEVYAQCGIRVSQIRVVFADSPSGNSVIRQKGENDLYIASRVPSSVSKPIVFYVKSHLGKDYAYARPAIWESNAPLKDTAWITYYDEEVEKKWYHPSYSVESHELGHLFSGESHLKGKQNLMA